MLNRRSILKLLGCAPCVPLAPKVHEYFDDWQVGHVTNTFYPDPDPAYDYSRISLCCPAGTCIRIPDKPRLHITADGMGGSYLVSNIGYWRRTNHSTLPRQQMFDIKIYGRIPDIDKWYGKHVHFKVEAD